MPKSLVLAGENQTHQRCEEASQQRSPALTPSARRTSGRGPRWRAPGGAELWHGPTEGRLVEGAGRAGVQTSHETASPDRTETPYHKGVGTPWWCEWEPCCSTPTAFHSSTTTLCFNLPNYHLLVQYKYERNYSILLPIIHYIKEIQLPFPECPRLKDELNSCEIWMV